ncbi:putative BLI-3 blue-light-inducible Bli-3 protein [Annulohypoxylon truncatum]|uniref:putative BLI-3 blue-light-inducible Bli-3 protein n=1 Tax=Annulohypoxylon truncatum TaxID=327061 RepID=UPI002008DF1A|nr:putative BLI-3 blue-light-inducible Bli-3 protein [Annulohypoxylon truncatum]KAI1208467.1 putative BLI-3 blue-light-inducible Bli-3 protein [Annulohypoxylon truncatum]
MSAFSNTDTGNKPADPYKAVNKDDDLPASEKIETLNKFISSCKYGMMATRDISNGRIVSRCMALAAKENGGVDQLFFTNTESKKTDELENDPHVNVAFLDSSGQWASVSGTTSIETDRSLIKKYYNPTLKVWMGDLGDGIHDGSENDPRIAIIRVKISTVTYSVSDLTFVGFAAEVAKGTVTGQPANVSKLREISETEIQSWRASH